MGSIYGIPRCIICGKVLTEDLPNVFDVKYTYKGSIKYIQHCYCDECGRKIIPLIEDEMQFIFRNEKKLGGKET